jgi:hypothetical protein
MRALVTGTPAMGVYATFSYLSHCLVKHLEATREARSDYAKDYIGALTGRVLILL